MEATRRFWTLAATAVVLAALAVLTGRPVLLAGAAAVGGLLLVAQVHFVAALRTLDASLTVGQSLVREHVRKDSEVTLTLSVARTGMLPVTVESDLPSSLSTGAPSRVELDPDDDTAETVVTLRPSTVGATTVRGVTVETHDRFGLFRERLPRGESLTLTVEARRPRNVHVGQGGDRTVSTLGGHRSGRHGEGVDPAELRKYTPGDTVSDIDWKATARLATPHVREYEVETDRRTLFFVDHRAAMDIGPEGETMLAYQREVALALAATARDLDDPLGLYAVGDAGTTAELEPATGMRQYERIRSALVELEPTAESDADSSANTVSEGPATARRKAARLTGDSAFDRTLRPYFANGDGYLTRISEDPLFETVRTRLARLEGSALSVLFTDDTDRAELHEAVNLARQGPGHVVVFLTPTVLFEPGGLSDLEGAYERYRAFEEFRRDLDRLTDVTAYEVGPGDRIEALLAARRRIRS